MPEVSENSLVIVGEEDIVMGFKALGFKVYTVKEPQDFRFVLDEVRNQKAAICLVQENIYQDQKEEIDSYRSQALPVFIPFTKDARNILLEEAVKDIRMKATGTF